MVNHPYKEGDKVKFVRLSFCDKVNDYGWASDHHSLVSTRKNTGEIARDILNSNYPLDYNIKGMLMSYLWVKKNQIIPLPTNNKLRSQKND